VLKVRISDVKDFTRAVRRVANSGSAIDPIIVWTLHPSVAGNAPLAID
jgi:hypothetical protein